MQQNKVWQFQRDYLKKYFNLEIKEKIPRCTLLRLLTEKNKAILDQNELEKIYKEKCSGLLQFSHTDWTDTVYINHQNELVRTKNSDKGKILKQTQDSIVVKWDLWGTETFKREKDNHYILEH